MVTKKPLKDVLIALLAARLSGVFGGGVGTATATRGAHGREVVFQITNQRIEVDAVDHFRLATVVLSVINLLLDTDHESSGDSFARSLVAVGLRLGTEQSVYGNDVERLGASGGVIDSRSFRLNPEQIAVGGDESVVR